MDTALQDAVTVQMAAEAESPEYMTSLRSALEAAASEAGSGVSGDSVALARCIPCIPHLVANWLYTSHMCGKIVMPVQLVALHVAGAMESSLRLR